MVFRPFLPLPRAVSFAVASTLLCVIHPAHAYDPYESRLDTQYKSLSNSISGAFSVPNRPYTPPTYSSSTSSYSSSYSTPSRSSAPSYGGRDQYTWKDYASKPARTVQPSIWDVRLATHNAIVAKAEADPRKPEPIAENEAALTDHYNRAGLDPYTAMRVAKGEIFRALEANGGLSATAPRAQTDAERKAAFEAWQVRDTAEEKAAIAAMAEVKTRALAGDKAAMKSWIERAEYVANKWPRRQSNLDARAESVEWSAQNGDLEAIVTAWNLRTPSNTTNVYADPAKAKVWQDKLIALGNLEATVSAAETLMQKKPSNFALAAHVLETGYGIKPDARLAYRLTQVHALGDTTLPPDAVKAYEWMRKALSNLGAPGDTYEHYSALKYAADNPQLVAAHGPEMLAAWQELVKVPAVSNPYHRVLADILSGRDKRYDGSGIQLDLKAATEYARIALATKAAWDQNKKWAGRFYWDTRQYHMAEVVYDQMEKEDAYGDDRWTIGLFWRDRPDGKANWDRAFANFSAAAPGLAHGGYLMADMYFTGEGTPRNPAAAIEWLRWGVKKKQASSMFRLAGALIRGEGVDKNPDEARTLIEQGLKDVWIGDDFKNDARFDLALLDARAKLQGTTPAQGFKAMQEVENGFRTLAMKNVKRAQLMWGNWVLVEGVNNTPANVLAATELLREQALDKEPEAMYILGSSIYAQTQSAQIAGKLTEPDAQLRYQEAADLLEAAEELKFPYAARGIGVMYRHGLGRPRNLATAIGWLEKAVARGDKAVEFILAEAYIEEGPQQNKARAVELLQKGVDRDDHRATNLLGVFHLKGIGVPQDSAKAVDLFTKAVAGGSWEAARNRYKVTYLGMGVPATPAAATAQFLKDVEPMRPKDWFLTGLLFLNDPAGSPFLPKPDPAAARPWLEKAAAANVPGAADKLKALTKPAIP